MGMDIQMFKQLDKFFDAYSKKRLSNKKVLAYILQHVVAEYAAYSLEEIVPCIEKDDDQLINVFPEEIFGLNVERTTITEGMVRYDLLFSASLPHSGNKVDFYMNIETQNMKNISYDIFNRAKVYMGHLITKQYDLYKNSKYDCLKPVISIWMCKNGEKKNVIETYEMIRRTKYLDGTEIEEKIVKDRIVLIDMGDELCNDEFIRFIQVLLSPLSKANNQILANEYQEVLSKQEIEEDTKMCNIGQMWREEIAEEAIAEGLAKGMAQGIEEGMAQGIERGMAQGIEQGMAQGIEQGTTQGLKQGKEMELLKNIKSIMKTCHFTLHQALHALEISEEEYSKYEKLMITK